MSDQPQEKTCSRCATTQPIEDFPPYRTKKPNGTTVEGRRGWCRDCTRQYNREYRWRTQKLRAKSERKYRWKKQFGLTEADYRELLEAQGGVCAICREKCSVGRRLAVDHDHESGRVRGLLCFRCNRALGGFQDNVEHLSRAVQYLERANG